LHKINAQKEGILYPYHSLLTLSSQQDRQCTYHVTPKYSYASTV